MTTKQVIVDGIDTNRDSRQLPVYGFDAMRRMLNTDVFIVGTRGLGVEIGGIFIVVDLNS